MPINKKGEINSNKNYLYKISLNWNKLKLKPINSKRFREILKSASEIDKPVFRISFLDFPFILMIRGIGVSPLLEKNESSVKLNFNNKWIEKQSRVSVDMSRRIIL